MVYHRWKEILEVVDEYERNFCYICDVFNQYCKKEESHRKFYQLLRKRKKLKKDVDSSMN